MSKYKEIVTKAVLGKGKKFFNNKYTVEVIDNPSTILGCWIINHKFNGRLENNDVLVNGSFDINIWYSYDNDTKTNVVSEKINYNDLINIKSKISTPSNSDIIVKALIQPECKNVNIDGKKINFDIDKELGIEVVGDEKIKILTEDDDDDWENLDDLNQDISDIIDESVDEDIIKY